MLADGGDGGLASVRWFYEDTVLSLAAFAAGASEGSQTCVHACPLGRGEFWMAPNALLACFGMQTADANRC